MSSLLEIVAPTPGASGIQQMLEIFKIQYFMRFFNKQKRLPPIYSLFALIAYEQYAKQVPQFVHSFSLWMYNSIIKSLQPKQIEYIQKPNKMVRAYIQFERNPDAKVTDPRIDAVLHHVCTLPDVKSLRFNGIEMVPNFKDVLMIENDIWFEIMDSSNSQYSGISLEDAQEQIVYKLSTYDHDIKWLHCFVERTIEAFEQEKKNKLGSEMYYFDHIVGNTESFRNPRPKNAVWFKKSKFNSNRTLKNVYMRQGAELQERVDFFMKRRDWYDSKGIPHTLGIVMWGQPGCGKTSTIKALANETKRHIFNIMLSEIKTKEALKDLFYNDTVILLNGEKLETYHIPLHKRLYVIEDIDAMDSIVLKRTYEQQAKEEERRLKLEAEMEAFKEKQGKDMFDRMTANMTQPTDALDLATLLNVLDGVRETPGRIIVLSTNYPERLDEALLRPGRFDMMIEYEKHPVDILKIHIETFYDRPLSKQQTALLSQPSLDKKWTAAEVSQILFKYITNMTEAIRCIVEENPVTYFRFSNITEEPDFVQPFLIQNDKPEKPEKPRLRKVERKPEPKPESEPEPTPKPESEPEPTPKPEPKPEPEETPEKPLDKEVDQYLHSSGKEAFTKEQNIVEYSFTEEDKQALERFTSMERDFGRNFVSGNSGGSGFSTW